MRPDLASRDTEVTELMDDPGCDLTALVRTYGQFRLVNAALAGWHRIYRRRLRPLLRVGPETRLLDIGSGAGDVPRALARWAARDGLSLAVTAIDPDPRAHAYVTAAPPTRGVVFRQATSAELVAAGEQFDVVTSNHLLHHLDEAGRRGLLDDSARLARRLVVHNDIARSRPAYLAYAALTWPLGQRSFLHTDGLRSIRRSYRPSELAAVVDEPWRVAAAFPARLLLTCEPTGARPPRGESITL